ncbi:protein of unknown function [Thauera humireducens]|nr:protein of unknown function [Thauera humireducens]
MSGAFDTGGALHYGRPRLRREIASVLRRLGAGGVSEKPGGTARERRMTRQGFAGGGERLRRSRDVIQTTRARCRCDFGADVARCRDQ